MSMLKAAASSAFLEIHRAASFASLGPLTYFHTCNTCSITSCSTGVFNTIKPVARAETVRIARWNGPMNFSAQA